MLHRQEVIVKQVEKLHHQGFGGTDPKIGRGTII